MNFKKSNSLGFLIRREPIVSMLMILLILITLLLSVLLPGKVFTLNNFQSLAFQLPEFGILTLATMITLISGGINLSIIATANMCGLVTAFTLTYLVNNTSLSHIFSIIVAIFAGWLISLIIGFLNGFIIAYLEVSPILTTLGIMTLIQGLNILFTKNNAISGFPIEFTMISNGTLKGIPISFLIFLIVFSLVLILLTKTPFGINLYLIGSNKTATGFSGINVKITILKIYIISSFLCGIASTILIAHFNSAKANYASSYLLLSILASVLGGVDPSGGFGKPVGILLSLIILQIVSSGLNLLGLSTHLTLAIWGLILILTIKFKDIKYLKDF
jgi:ribose/xylose/arabinose/galactoside ABC-type transport system permease subunit